MAQTTKDNIPQGFQKNEVGVIPEDWEVDEIQNVCQITTGNKDTQDKIENGIYPFYVRSPKVERINTYSFDGEAVLTAGDGVGTGKIFHYINGKFDFHQRVYKMSDFSEKLNGYFFFVYFSNYFFNRISLMTAKSSVDSVRRDMIGKMTIPIPPLKEQTAIANALSDMDALIEAQEKLIHKKRLIKQGAMQELLKPKEGWVEKKLGEVGIFSKGSGIKKEEAQSGNIPCIRYGEIYTRHNFRVKRFFSFISEDVAKNAKKIKYGDILFTGSGETIEDIGKCVSFLLTEEAYAGGDIILFSPRQMSSEFLGFLLNSETINKQKAIKGQGDKIVHITARQLGTIKIKFPPLTEQQQIAQTLSDMDTEIEQRETQLSKDKQMKAGVMQELLMGKKRLYR